MTIVRKSVNHYSSVPVTARYVCFNCRKCFHSLYLKRAEGDHKPCPECQKPMHYAGVHLRTPRKQDVKGWKLLERLLVECGVKFFTNGNGYIPKANYEIAPFDAERKRGYADFGYGGPRKRISWNARPIFTRF